MTEEDSLIGQTLDGRYEIISLCGRGGMSTVYKARHLLLDRLVAVKVLHMPLLGDTILVKRFQREATIVSSLTHPNIVDVYALGVSSQGLPYLVMDYLDGRTLADIIRNDGCLSSEQALPVFKQIAGAMAYASSTGVIHRDLKPGNILVLADGNAGKRIKILDFGIAKFLPTSGKTEQALTRTTATQGSPAYMSPEQCLSKEVDQRSDIYSMGCLMYETLTGSPPFAGKNALDIMAAHVSAPVRAFGRARPGLKVDLALESVVCKCLEKNPLDRYQSWEELLEDLGCGYSQPAKSGRAPKGKGGGSRIWQPGGAVCKQYLQLAAVSITFAVALALTIVVFRLALTSDSGTEQLCRLALALHDALADQDDPGLLNPLMQAGAWCKQKERTAGAAILYRRAQHIASQQSRLSLMIWQAMQNLFAMSGTASSGDPRPTAALTALIFQQTAMSDQVRLASCLKDLAEVSPGASQSDLEDMRWQAAEIYKQIALSYQQQSNYQEARRWFSDMVEMDARARGPDTTESAEALSLLAQNYSLQKDYATSEKLCRQAYTIYRRLRHTSAAPTLMALAYTLNQQKKFAEAAQIYREALSMYENLEGGQGPHVAVTLQMLVNTYKEQNNLPAARAAAERLSQLADNRKTQGKRAER